MTVCLPWIKWIYSKSCIEIYKIINFQLLKNIYNLNYKMHMLLIYNTLLCVKYLNQVYKFLKNKSWNKTNAILAKKFIVKDVSKEAYTYLLDKIRLEIFEINKNIPDEWPISPARRKRSFSPRVSFIARYWTAPSSYVNLFPTNNKFSWIPSKRKKIQNKQIRTLSRLKKVS